MVYQSLCLGIFGYNTAIQNRTRRSIGIHPQCCIPSTNDRAYNSVSLSPPAFDGRKVSQHSILRDTQAPLQVEINWQVRVTPFQCIHSDLGIVLYEHEGLRTAWVEDRRCGLYEALLKSATKPILS